MDAKREELEKLRARVAQLESEIDADVSRNAAADHLVFFYGESCPFTKRALPAVKCLERSLGRPIVRKETWNDAANHADWEAAGGAEECGGVPYFFNTVTKESVCGAADCETLKKWAISAGLSSNLN